MLSENILFACIVGIPSIMLGMVLLGRTLDARVYQPAIEHIEANRVAQMTSFLARMSGENKKKLFVLLNANPDTLAVGIKSRNMLELLIQHGLDINHPVLHSATPSAPEAMETLFTFALQERLDATNTYAATPLADMLLQKYEYDFAQIKKFEEQLKNSRLKLYTPLAQQLKIVREKLELEDSMVEVYQSPKNYVPRVMKI